MQINDSQLVALLMHVMKLAGCKRQQGTYNNADPTAFYRIKGWAHFDYDPLYVESADYPAKLCPWPNAYHVEVHDVTWGIRINLEPLKGECIPLDRARGFYLDGPDFKDLSGDTERDLRKFLWACIADASWSNEQPADDDYPTPRDGMGNRLDGEGELNAP